ncbi:1-aminocyclopropane-1-carboxylate deaminase/D-cysteine desulfhydrase [Georgenia muralis]
MSPQVFRSSPLEDWSDQFGRGSQRVFVKRDDLLPFPLAGNKVRKLERELQLHKLAGRTVVTVGAITSNHCRTLALMCARQGLEAELLLHGDPTGSGSRVALAIFDAMGTKYHVVKAEEIPSAIKEIVQRHGENALLIPGGCHTLAGVEAYADAISEVQGQCLTEPDTILVATGTGATHAGLIAGCDRVGWGTKVLGISIAREHDRAVAGVAEALSWTGSERRAGSIGMTDKYRAGGYGLVDSRTSDAVARTLELGLPVDGTYMGKVLAAFFDLNREESLGETVLIWHTGGLANYLFGIIDDIDFG